RPGFTWRFCMRTFSTRTRPRAVSTASTLPCLPRSDPLTTRTTSPLRMPRAITPPAAWSNEGHTLDGSNALRQGAPRGDPPRAGAIAAGGGAPGPAGTLPPVPALLVRLVVAVLALVAVAAAACHLLPGRFAVNAPLRHPLVGRGGDTDPGVRATRPRVPPGLALDVWVRGLAGARGRRPTPAGDVLVSTPRSGRVLLVERDADGDGAPDAVRTLLEGLDRPHGLDLHDGWLYVGETGAVARVRFDPATRRTEGPVERVVTDLPAGGNHWTRTVRIGPDGWLYVSVGSSCNACVEVDPRRAALLRYRPDGSGEEIVASGLRNSVGFDWHPETGALYATDNAATCSATTPRPAS